MSFEQNELESRIKAAVGMAPAPNFEAWLLEHGEVETTNASGKLHRIGSDLPGKPRTRLWQFAMAAMFMAPLLGAAIWILTPNESLFARTIMVINRARTITWVHSNYQKLTSADGKRHWLQKEDTKSSYMEPGLYRHERLDKDGKLTQVTITDLARLKRLTLDMKSRMYELEELDPQIHEPKEPDAAPDAGKAKLDAGPFRWLNRGINEGGEIVGQRKVESRTVDVLRWRNKAMGIHNPKNQTDIWIDAKTKEMVGASHPASNVFDPETLDYRDNPSEDKFYSAKILGSISGNIALDVELDPKIFALTIPDGFEERKKRETIHVTEQEFLEYLKAVAIVNDNQFPNSLLIRNTEKIFTAGQKPKEQKSDAEKNMGEIWYRHMLNDNTMPLIDFLNEQSDSYPYFGKGVKLGDADKVILLIRLKNTGEYRGVWGDLRVEDFEKADAKAILESQEPNGIEGY